MRRTAMIVAAMMLFAVGSAGAITRVAARYNSIQFFGGTSTPVGQYDQFADIPFIGPADGLFEIAAEDLFESAFHLGLSYGSLRNDRVSYSLGFTYTKVELTPFLAEIYVAGASSSLFDVDFNLDYYINNPVKSPFTPYFGVGFHGGLLTISADGYESDNHVKIGLSARFGAEFKISENIEKGSSFSLVSNNWYTFAASDGRPKYMNFGLGLKYYFRP